MKVKIHHTQHSQHVLDEMAGNYILKVIDKDKGIYDLSNEQLHLLQDEGITFKQLEKE